LDLKEAQQLHADADKSMSDIYQRIVEYKKFYKGEQWYPGDENYRRTKKRPCLTINQTKRYVKRVTNEQRKNKPQIKIIPAGYGADKATAAVYDDLIRRIRNHSRARAAYNTAHHSGVAYGLGFFRIDVDYISNYSFEQDLFINRIRNEQTVKFNLNEIKEFDFSDAENCFIELAYTKAAFENNPAFKGIDPISFNSGKAAKSKDDRVFIMEHFEVVHKAQKLYLMGANADPTIQIPVFDEDMDEFMKEAQARGQAMSILDERDSEKRHVKRELINGGGSFDEKDTIFKWIPIVPVIGEEYDIDGELDFDGMVHPLMDPNRQTNYWRTSAVENVALAGKPKHIGPVGFMGTQEDKWAKSNVSDDPTLEYEVQFGPDGQPLPPPQFTQFNEIPAAQMALAQQGNEDFKLVSGMQDPALGIPMAGQSGIAENQLRQESDTANFDYIDNMTISLTQAGRILVDALPKLHNQENEEVTGMTEAGKEIKYTINRTKKDDDKDSFLRLGGEYSVVVTAGPGYATRRQESQAAMRSWIAANPENARLYSDLIFRTEDWDNSDEWADRAQAIIAKEHPEFFQEKGKLKPGQIMAIVQQNQELQQALQQMQEALKEKQTAQQLEKYKIDMSYQEEQLKAGVKAENEKLKEQGKALDTRIKEGAAIQKEHIKGQYRMAEKRIVSEVDIH
jgi:hypothetical protein